MKRSQKTPKIEIETYQVGKFTFEPKSYKLTSESEIVSLTEREAELLKYFLDNKNNVLKREQILKQIWGDDDYFMGRSLDVFISRLRKILITEQNITIENLHGIGFKFVAF